MPDPRLRPTFRWIALKHIPFFVNRSNRPDPGSVSRAYRVEKDLAVTTGVLGLWLDSRNGATSIGIVKAGRARADISGEEIIETETSDHLI